MLVRWPPQARQPPLHEFAANTAASSLLSDLLVSSTADAPPVEAIAYGDVTTAPPSTALPGMRTGSYTQIGYDFLRGI